MNHPTDNRPVDDQTLDTYLAGDSPFSRRYREMPASDVPPELDAKILAASKAPARKSALYRWRTWSAPVALAATVVIAIAVILRGGLEQAAVRAPEMKQRALSTPQSTVVPAAPPAASATVEADAVSRDELEDTRALKKEVAPSPVIVTAHKREAKEQGVPVAVLTQEDLQPAREPPSQGFANASVAGNAAPAAEQKPKTAAPEARRAEDITVTSQRTRGNSQDSASLQETVVTGSFVRRESAGAGPHGTVRPAEKSEQTLEREAREADPRYWLEYIRGLRQNNDVKAADREWKKFVKAYPDYAVPADDPARPPLR